MKAFIWKIIIMSLLIVAPADAAMRWGFGGDTDGGMGLFFTDRNWNASTTIQVSNDDDSNSDLSLVGFTWNYKSPITHDIDLTFGMGYYSGSGEENGVDIDTYTIVDLTTGAEYRFNENFHFILSLSIYKGTTIELIDATKRSPEEFFSGGSIGFAYLL